MLSQTAYRTAFLKVAALQVASMAITLLSSSSFAALVTVEGTIDKVVPEKREIYVLADGKKNEFYFNEKTEIVQNGAPIAFEVLKKAQKVKVTADKIGKGSTR